MLAINNVNKLKQLGIQANRCHDFVNGLKLMQLACQIFYNGQNVSLASKLRLTDDQKTGNNVLNINMVLNHLKKDSSIQMETDIRELSAFKLIQDDEAMTKIIEWMLSKRPVKQQYQNVHQEMSPPHQQENQFENLYFVSSIDKKEHNQNDSLEHDNPGERVVRKGSFKVLKPKVSTDSKSLRGDSKEREDFQNSYKHQNLSEFKEPLREMVTINCNNICERQEAQDLNIRKTIPKMYEKPPLYRPKPKQQTIQLKNERDSAYNSINRQANRDEIAKNIQYLQKQINQEESSLVEINKESAKPQKSLKKSVRKIFKLQLQEPTQKKKKILLEWLIGINLLSSSSIKYLNELQAICKDGVIFMQILNYYKGRGKDIGFFKEPKKSAEMHSNYQKLFQSLQQMPQFRCDLLHQYEYFIPEAQSNAFWNLLSSIHTCFFKQIKPKDTKIIRYDSTIRNKLDNESSVKRKTMNQSVSYNQIKFNTQSAQQFENKNHFSSTELPRKSTPKPVNSRDKVKSRESHSRQSSKQKQVEFQESRAFCGLVQNQQPQQDNAKTQRGYKQMYLCKFKNINIETPHKNKSFCNSSLSKSRIRASAGSSKKKEQKPIIPSISLQMQMKVLKYLKSYQIEEENQQLFKDPYRNGLLLCHIVKRQLNIDCYASRKPSNIDDCRNNYLMAIATIKKHYRDIRINYDVFVEELIKGERTLLYGIICNLIKNQKEGFIHQPSIRLQFQQDHAQGSNEEWVISWIRSIQKINPNFANFKIRNQLSLHIAIVNTDFLFQYSWLITGKKAVTPTYDRPINSVQKQSNLKKVLGYLVQSKVIRSDYLWKSRNMVAKENDCLKELINDLIVHFNHLHNKEQMRTVNFVKYLKRQDGDSKQRMNQKLQTTMANQTITQQNIQIEPVQKKVIQVNWMRKLGFNGNLQLNNGVILCRLLSRLNMKTIDGVNQNPQTRAQCLGNIRRALKQISKSKWDQFQIYEADHIKNMQIYTFLKQKYKHSYAMKFI